MAYVDLRLVLNSLQLPELMLLRGMHDVGGDDIHIIVTDLERREMDDVTEYFKLVCRHTFGRTCKPSMGRKIQYEREPPFVSAVTIIYMPSRYAFKTYAPPTANNALFSADRPHASGDIVREKATLRHPFFPSNNFLLPNIVHTPFICPLRKDILRLPRWLSQSLLHARLRNDSFPKMRG